MKPEIDTGPPGAPKKGSPPTANRGRRKRKILTRTVDVRCRRVKPLELLRRRFWQGDVTARASIIKILRESQQ